MITISKIKNKSLRTLKSNLEKFNKDRNLNGFLFDLKRGVFDEYFKNEHILQGEFKISPDRLNSADPSSKKRFEASKIVYEDLKDLSIEEAHDVRLWSFLSLYVYRGYCINRYKKGREGNKKTILTRFFTIGDNYLTFTRNYISGLYWTAKKTYDNNLDDPYYYTKLIYSNTQLTQDLMERFDFLKDKNFIQAFLDLSDDLLKKSSGVTTQYSRLMSSVMLNHYKNHHFTHFSKDQIREELNAHYDFQQSIGRIKVKRI